MQPEAEQNEKQIVAIKKVKQQGFGNGLHHTLLREIKLLKELNHINVVKLYDVFYLKDYMYFALEYGDVGDLSNLTNI